MKEGSSEEDTNVSLTHLQASRYPLMRRLDQQFVLENKLSDYQKEISRVSSMNKVALSSLGHQERRLRELQARLRSTQTTNAFRRSDANIPSAPGYELPNAHQTAYDDKQHLTKIETAVKGHSKRLAPITTNMTSDGPCVPLAPTNFRSAKISRNPFALRSDVPNNDVTSVNKDSRAPCVPDAPTNFLATEIRHDSFALRWDVVDHDPPIVDYKVKYSYSAEGREEHVLRGCSRWCLKDPVPNGRFVVQNLEPDTEYRDIVIRCRNHVGWSEFSNPIKCLSTASKDEDYENRRCKFLYRIGYIEQSVESLEETKQQIPAQQVLLGHNMSQAQKRMLELNEEIERVVSQENAQLSSHLLHGASQMFSKAALKRKLEQEVVKCKENIAGWRADIIDMDKESNELATEIGKQESRLRERKAALLKFDRQHGIISSMKLAVSRQPKDLEKYFITKWRSIVAGRLDKRRKLDSLARSCRRRIYARAWRQLCSLVASRRELVGNGNNVEPDGIGGMLLGAAEKCMQEDSADASHLIKQLDHMQQNQEKETTTIVERCPTNLLCKEDGALLTKGDFLFNMGHYESALKSFQLVLSKMESRDYFSGLASADTAALFADVNGKIGHVHIKLGSFDLGLVYFGRQLSLAEEEDLDEPRTGALMGLGICYHEKYDHQYAESFFERALELCLSRRDKSRELVVYHHLQKCCECLNRPADAAAFAEKIQRSDETSWERECGGTAVSRRGVEHAIQKLDLMRSCLVSVVSNKARVVKLEVASARYVQSLRAKSNKEQQLREALERLSESKQSSDELHELVEQIEYEIYEASKTKKKRLVSGLIQGHRQEIKAAELLFRLKEELRVVNEKLEECLAEISQTEMLIHNTKDDIMVLSEEMTIENCPLMRRVLGGREYRCISLNASNIACDDVTGMSKGGFPRVALSEGESCYIHSLETGKMEHVFVGDEEASTATITSLFFYGIRVYTGAMDSVLIGWDLITSKKLFAAKGHESAVTCIHADDSKVVSGSADKSIIVWNIDGTMIRRVGGHARGVHCIQCGPSWCVSASYSTIFVWDVLADKETDKMKGFKCRCRLVSEQNVTALQYGELEVITGDSLGTISVWWIESGELLKSFHAHDSPVTSLQVDSTMAISCGIDMNVLVSDIIRGQVLHTLRGHETPVLAVAFDGKRVVSLSSDGELRYWSWENPSKHSRSRSDNRVEMHADHEEVDLPVDLGSYEKSDAIENATEGDGSVSNSRLSKTKGTLMNRLAKKIPRR